jgi:hypothetical protein
MNRRWARTWALALVLVVVSVAAWEGAWRSRGFQPSVSGDIGLWAIERQRAVDGAGDGVVILGSSRVKTGIVPQALAAATGWKTPIQLAINFSSPVLALEDLAEDPRFHGLVIVDVAPIILFNAFWPLENMVGGYLTYRDTARWSESFNTWLTSLVESSFVFRLPELSGKHLLETLMKGELPTEQRFRDDRSRVTHVADSTASQAPPANAGDGGAVGMGREGLGKLIARLNAALVKLRSHQARAVFVSTPTAGAMAETENRLFPRDQYWDVFAKGIDAPAINCRDEAELAKFVPPDGSHFTSGQAVEFSRALGRVLMRVLTKNAEPSAQAGR